MTATVLAERGKNMQTDTMQAERVDGAWSDLTVTFDEKLRDMTNDIGRGTLGPVPVASEAMAERDEYGEVKGVLF